jgi:hypothetical protein
MALARKHRPSVIFMDLKMADLDGFEATRRLQADADTADIPVIAVTASAFGDTRTDALSAGCVDYLPKPVRAAALFAMMQRHLGVHFVSSAAPGAPSESAAGGPPRRDLAVRLSEAVELGAVTDLEAIAQELMGGDGAARRSAAASARSSSRSTSTGCGPWRRSSGPASRRDDDQPRHRRGPHAAPGHDSRRGRQPP